MYGDLPTICGGNWSSLVLALSTHGCRLARPLSWFVMCIVSASHSVLSMLLVNSATLFERPPLVLLRVPGSSFVRTTVFSVVRSAWLTFNIGNALCLVRRMHFGVGINLVPLDKSGVNFTKPV